MLQHRHVFPGYVGPASSNEKWWHDANMVHTKYPTAHDQPILGTREFTPGTRTKKPADPLYAYAPEYGPTKEEALYKTPPEYAALERAEVVEAVAEATTVLELAAAMTAAGDARMAERGIAPRRR